MKVYYWWIQLSCFFFGRFANCERGLRRDGVFRASAFSRSGVFDNTVVGKPAWAKFRLTTFFWHFGPQRSQKGCLRGHKGIKRKVREAQKVSKWCPWGSIFAGRNPKEAPRSHLVDFVVFVVKPISILTKKTWCPRDDPFFRSFWRRSFEFVFSRNGGGPKCDFEWESCTADESSEWSLFAFYIFP